MQRKYKSGNYSNNKINPKLYILEGIEKNYKIIFVKSVNVGVKKNNDKIYKDNYLNEYEDYYGEEY
jgi:hypothetical protein